MSLHLKKNIELLTTPTGLLYWGITLTPDDLEELLDIYNDNIFDAPHYQEIKEKIQGPNYILAITNPNEYSNFISYPMPYDPVYLDIKGLGMNEKQVNNKVYFGVVQSQDLTSLREKMSLPPIDFHIPLAFSICDLSVGRNNEPLPKNIVTWGVSGVQTKLKLKL